MSTVIQKEYARWGAGTKTNVLARVDQWIDMTMAAGAAVAVTMPLPAGVQRVTCALETPTAFSGSPTNINARVGLTLTGQEVVADTDVKAQGHITGTIVAALNQTNLAAAGSITLFLALAAVGGTNPAGTVRVYVGYAVPAPGN